MSSVEVDDLPLAMRIVGKKRKSPDTAHPNTPITCYARSGSSGPVLDQDVDLDSKSLKKSARRGGPLVKLVKLGPTRGGSYKIKLLLKSKKTREGDDDTTTCVRTVSAAVSAAYPALCGSKISMRFETYDWSKPEGNAIMPFPLDADHLLVMKRPSVLKGGNCRIDVTGDRIDWFAALVCATLRLCAARAVTAAVAKAGVRSLLLKSSLLKSSSLSRDDSAYVGRGPWFMTTEPRVNPAAELIGKHVVTSRSSSSCHLIMLVKPALTSVGTQHPFIYEVLHKTPDQLYLAGLAFGVEKNIEYLPASKIGEMGQDLEDHLSGKSGQAWSVVDLRILRRATPVLVDLSDAITRLDPELTATAFDHIVLSLRDVMGTTTAGTTAGTTASTHTTSTHKTIPTMRRPQASDLVQKTFCALWSSRCVDVYGRDRDLDIEQDVVLGCLPSFGARHRLKQVLSHFVSDLKSDQVETRKVFRRRSGLTSTLTPKMSQCWLCKKNMKKAGLVIGPTCEVRLGEMLAASVDVTDNDVAELNILMKEDPRGFTDKLDMLVASGKLDMSIFRSEDTGDHDEDVFGDYDDDDDDDEEKDENGDLVDFVVHEEEVEDDDVNDINDIKEADSSDCENFKDDDSDDDDDRDDSDDDDDRDDSDDDDEGTAETTDSDDDEEDEDVDLGVTTSDDAESDSDSD